MTVAADGTVVAGAGTGRGSGVAGVRVAEGGTGDQVKAPASAPETKGVTEEKDTKDAVTLASDELPGSDKPFEEGMDMNRVWLLLAAAAVIITVAAYGRYRKHQNK